MGWLFLVGAIISEVVATLALRSATLGNKLWYILVTIGYLIAFAFLSLTLHTGMSLGVAYGIWAASGVALTAIGGKILFKEPLTLIMTGGIILIIGGVLLIELGGSH